MVYRVRALTTVTRMQRISAALEMISMGLQTIHFRAFLIFILFSFDDTNQGLKAWETQGQGGLPSG